MSESVRFARVLQQVIATIKGFHDNGLLNADDYAYCKTFLVNPTADNLQKLYWVVREANQLGGEVLKGILTQYVPIQ